MARGNRTERRYKAGAPRTYWRGSIGRTARAALEAMAHEDTWIGFSQQEAEETIVAAAILAEQARRRNEKPIII